MHSTLYQLSLYLFVALVVFLLVLVYRFCLWLRGLSQSRVATNLLVVIACWVLCLSILAGAGLLAQWNRRPPPMLLVFVLPLLGLFFLLRSPSLHNAWPRLPLGWLIGVQSFRILMEVILLLLYKAGQIPIQMTFEGWNWDILTGLTALPVWWLYLRKHNPTILVIWNIAGLILLVTVVAIAVLSSPSPMRVFMNEPSSALVAHMPWVLLPGMVVPVAYYCHALSLRQLLTR